MARVAKREELSQEQLTEFLHDMLLIRRFEEKVEERFRAGELPGFLHVAIGQEAVCVGVCRAMGEGDVFASTHRAHGHTLARGTSPNALMAELYGKVEAAPTATAARCTSTTSRAETSVRTRSSGAACPRSPARRSRSSCAASLGSRWPSSATGRRISARFTSR